MVEGVKEFGAELKRRVFRLMLVFLVSERSEVVDAGAA